MLTAFKALNVAEMHILKVIEQLGYVNGNIADKPKKTAYYKDICLDTEKAKCRHIRYSLISANVSSRCDNTVRSREVMASIDVFSPTLKGLAIMEEIEESFMKNGWETELEQAITGVDDFHSSLNIYKIITEV